MWNAAACPEQSRNVNASPPPLLNKTPCNEVFMGVLLKKGKSAGLVLPKPQQPQAPPWKPALAPDAAP
jgi:hypothetical protein